MIDAKDFIKDGGVDFSLIDDCINPFGDSPFEICRLSIKHSEIELSKQIGEYINKKGYRLVINLMGISLLSDSEIKEFGTLNELKPDALYFDSYGNLTPDRTTELVKLFSEFGCEVGVHTHDNLGLFSNCLSAEKEGQLGLMELFLEWVEVSGMSKQNNSSHIISTVRETKRITVNLFKR